MKISIRLLFIALLVLPVAFASTTTNANNSYDGSTPTAEQLSKNTSANLYQTGQSDNKTMCSGFWCF